VRSNKANEQLNGIALCILCMKMNEGSDLPKRWEISYLNGYLEHPLN